jgi:dTDP-4-amino-4,6-dideoxy-D-galactose acyltransferase
MSAAACARPDLDALRARLPDCLPWAPLEFLPPISTAGERARHLGHLLRDLDEADDLRFVHRFPSGVETAVLAERLPWDSAFFGYGVAKLHGVVPLGPVPDPAALDVAGAVQALLRLARARGVRYLFAAVEPRDLCLLRALARCSFALIESRLYFHRSVADYAYPERFGVRTATAADVEVLGRTARETVNPYDRFHADPSLDAQDVGRLMARWVEASVLDGFADVTFVPDVPRPSAFITVNYHRKEWDRWGLRLAQPIFGAVAPEFKGWYLKLLSEINYHLREIGAAHTIVCTQVTNKAVLRCWEKMGYHYGQAEHVFRALP